MKKQINGHTTPDTAYVVDDYPYGYTLRCKIRYWLEYRKGFGYRLVSQTTNPKVSGEVWNKPKPGGYSDFTVMYLDDKGHVHIACCASYNGIDDLMKFKAEWYPTMDDKQRESFMLMLLRSMLLMRESWCRWLITKGYLEINSWAEQNKVVFYRLIMGLNKDNCVPQRALAELPGLIALLASRAYEDKSESFYHLMDEARLFKPSDKDKHAVWKVGEREAMWSGTINMPPIGKRIMVTINKFGPGIVRAYFIEAGFFGVEVILENRPEWHVAQNGDAHATPLVFGAEIEDLPQKK